jgi:hypothetical protein
MYARSTRSAATSMFWWAVFAILLQFVFPYVVLQAMGLDAQKLREHPSTFLVIICGTYALLNGAVPFHQRCREAPGLVLFVCIIPLLNIYSAYFNGISGAALYAESYLAPGMLAVMLSTSSQHQKRLLGRILIALCVFNVLVGLFESLTSTTWFPLAFDPDAPITEVDVDFRANAFYNHPLTASLVTSMAVFLLFAMRLRLVFSAPIYGLLLVGLLAFGGRTALGVTLLMSVGTAIYLLFAGIIRRNLKLDLIVIIVSAAIFIPILLAIIITQTSIADRIMDTLYFDGSAQTRATQLEIFRHLSLRNWLFGISHDDLNVLKYQIGLGGKDTDIENFWILMLLNLGGLGFLVFLVVLGTFLLHMARSTHSMYGWLLVVGALVIDSGSNSLGSKSSDLFVEVGFLVAISGYADYARSPRMVVRNLTTTLAPLGQFGTIRPQGALGRISSVRTRGLRLLGSRIS